MKGHPVLSAVLIWLGAVVPIAFFMMSALRHGWSNGAWILAGIAFGTLAAGIVLVRRGGLGRNGLVYAISDVLIVILGNVFMEY